MENAPKIVIRTAEEREAMQAERVFLAELPRGNGIMEVRLERKPQLEKEDGKFLVFEDRETAIAWACLRVKDLSIKGFEIFAFPPAEIRRRFPDKRVAAPVAEHRGRPLSEMLEW